MNYLLIIKALPENSKMSSNTEIKNNDATKAPKIRKSPSKKAKDLEIGTIETGLDGNQWIIVENKNNVKRWKKHNENKVIIEETQENIEETQENTEETQENIEETQENIEETPKKKLGRPLGSKNKNKKEKRTRKPTAYNLFIQEKMNELIRENKYDNGRERFKAAVGMWNTQKKAVVA